jgi:hypothetical protein
VLQYAEHEAVLTLREESAERKLHIEAVEGEGFGEVLHRVHAGNRHAPRVLFTGHIDYIRGHIDCSRRTTITGRS